MLCDPVPQLDDVYFSNGISKLFVRGAGFVAYEIPYWCRQTVNYVL